MKGKPTILKYYSTKSLVFLAQSRGFSPRVFPALEKVSGVAHAASSSREKNTYIEPVPKNLSATCFIGLWCDIKNTELYFKSCLDQIVEHAIHVSSLSTVRISDPLEFQFSKTTFYKLTNDDNIKK